MGGMPHTCNGEGSEGKERKKHGVEGRKWKEGRKEKCHSTTCDNKLNENHRLDSDLSTYNKVSGITLCITEMAMH